MSTVEEIKSAIKELPYDEYPELNDWISDRNCHDWDQQLLQDSESGALHFLLDEAKKEAGNGLKGFKWTRPDQGFGNIISPLITL